MGPENLEFGHSAPRARSFFILVGPENPSAQRNRPTLRKFFAIRGAKKASARENRPTRKKLFAIRGAEKASARKNRPTRKKLFNSRGADQRTSPFTRTLNAIPLHHKRTKECLTPGINHLQARLKRTIMNANQIRPSSRLFTCRFSKAVNIFPNKRN